MWQDFEEMAKIGPRVSRSVTSEVPLVVTVYMWSSLSWWSLYACGHHYAGGHCTVGGHGVCSTTIYVCDSVSVCVKTLSKRLESAHAFQGQLHPRFP